MLPKPQNFISVLLFSKLFKKVGFIIFSLLQNFGEGVFIIFSFPGSRIQWISPDFDPFLSVFPLRNRILGVPKPPKFSACGRLSPLTGPF